MTLSVKSNDKIKKLIEESKFERVAYTGENTSVSYKAEWVDLTINNQNINLPGGQELVKIGQLPSNCSHPFTPIGVFGLLTSGWEPSNDLVYVSIQSDGSITARSKAACKGVLYLHFITNQMSVNFGGGGLKFIQKFRTFLNKIIGGINSNPKGGLVICR